jgi:hypothetical protein
MNNLKDYIFLAIFGFLVIQNTLIIFNILISPKGIEKGWLSFPAGEDKFRKVLYCLYAVVLFILAFYWRFEKISG